MYSYRKFSLVRLPKILFSSCFSLPYNPFFFCNLPEKQKYSNIDLNSIENHNLVLICLFSIKSAFP